MLACVSVFGALEATGCGASDDSLATPTSDAGVTDADYADFGPHQVTYLDSVPDALVGAYTLTFPTNVVGAVPATSRLDVTAKLAFLSGDVGNAAFDAFRIESGAFWLSNSAGDFVRVPLGADGLFSGYVSVAAKSGSGEGSIRVDHDPPVTSIDVPLPADGLSGIFPWAPITVRLSETVDPVALRAAITADTPSLIVDDVPSDPSFDFGRARTTSVHPSSWSDVDGTTAHVMVGSIGDPSGNASLAVDAGITFLSVPAASAVTFATGAPSVLTWDPASTGKLTFRGTADSACESGSCLELGPFDHANKCELPDVGFAARVMAATPFTKVSIRYRGLVTSTDGTPISDTPGEASVFVITTRTSAFTSVGILTSELTPTTDLAMTMSTGWRTAILTLSVPATEVGVVLRTASACHVVGDVIGSDTHRSILLVGGVTAE